MTRVVTMSSADSLERAGWRRGALTTLGRVARSVPAVVLALVVAMALLAPWLTPWEPTRGVLIERMTAPEGWGAWGSGHPLGTDSQGRDVLARLAYGARISLVVATATIVVGAVVGTVAGLVAALAGGWVDSLLMRVVDLVLSLPMVLVAVSASVILRPSIVVLIIIISVFMCPRFARQVRGEALVIAQQDYVRYARATRVPTLRILARHLLPNVMPTLLVMATLEVGHVILLEASLSFLGVGVPAPQPSWGSMVADGRALMQTGWWLVLFPGIAIMLTVFSINTLGDRLRIRLDPTLQERR